MTCQNTGDIKNLPGIQSFQSLITPQKNGVGPGWFSPRPFHPEVLNLEVPNDHSESPKLVRADSQRKKLAANKNGAASTDCIALTGLEPDMSIALPETLRNICLLGFDMFIALV